MAYLYSSVLTDICSQLGDPDMNEYEERAKDHFLRAVSQFVSTGEFNEGDVYGYETVDKTLEFTADECDISSISPLFIKAITPPLTTLLTDTTRYTINLISFDDAQLIIGNTLRQPSDDEVYIFRMGNTLYSIKSSGSNFAGTAGTFWVFYVQDIAGGYADAYDLTDKMRESFIRKCVEMAVQTLKQEDVMTS
jgi:hypothetical protein